MANSTTDIIDQIIPDKDIVSAFLEISSEVIWVKDIVNKKNQWHASPANQIKYGLSEDADFWANHLHPEERVRVVAGFEHALHDKQTLYYEHNYQFCNPKGDYFYIRDKIKFVRNHLGQPLKAIGVWQDVTDSRRKQSKLERALETLEADRLRFKHISEVSNLAMWEIDFAHNRFSWTSGSKALEDFGLFKTDYSLQDWENSIFEEDRPRVVENFEHHLQSKNEKYFDAYRVVKADGSLAFIINQGTFFRDETGKAYRALGGWIDITREREREQVLERALERQRKLNKDLAIREEELVQVNAQLEVNLEVSAEREFILTQSQRLAKVGSWEYDPETKLVFWSEEMYNIYGVDRLFNVNNREETARLYEEADRETINSIFTRLDDVSTFPFDVMVRIQTPQGHRKWVRITGYQQAEEGKFRRALGLVYDITFFKEAEERLMISEQKFSKAFNNNPDLMVITRESDLLIYDVNEQVYPTLGYKRDEVVGRISTEFKFFVDAADRTTFFTRYKNTGFVEMECRWLHKSGHIIHILLTSSKIELNGEKYFISVIKDITQKKESEERLQRSEANLNATINNTDFMIWSIDRAFRLQTYNQSFSEFMLSIFGRPLQVGRLIFENPETPVEVETKERWTERYMRALAGEIVKIEEPRWGRYFQFSLSPIIENNFVTGVSVFAEDVTERVERDRLLVEANQKIGELKLMALRSVMNPHFIFNALNSIQYFIGQNDRKNAINYLSTFSKLIRAILNNSVNNKIKLAEELEQIKYYIDLEAVRFDHKFDFVLDIDPDIDIESIFVPSLLIQPYVENAILHGLYNKKDHGTLKITVREEDEAVLFEIEDDGVGREEAMRIRQQNFPKHKSMGTALTEERLKLINAKDDVAFEIIDLMKDGVPAGTRVKIWVKA